MRSTRSRCCGRSRADEGGAVRRPGGRRQAGQARGRGGVDAGPAGPRGLRAQRRGLAADRRGRRPRASAPRRCGCCTPPCPQADGDRPQLPRPRRGVGARHPCRAGGVRQVADVADRPPRSRSWSRARRRGPTTRARWRWCSAATSTARTRDQARAAVGGITAFHDVSGRRAQLETPLRQFTLGKSFDTFAPMGPCVASADGVDLDRHRHRHVGQRRAAAVVQHPQPDLLDRRADRVPVEGDDAGGRRRDRHRHARRRRRLARAAALPAPRATWSTSPSPGVGTLRTRSRWSARAVCAPREGSDPVEGGVAQSAQGCHAWRPTIRLKWRSESDGGRARAEEGSDPVQGAVARSAQLRHSLRRRGLTPRTALLRPPHRPAVDHRQQHRQLGQIVGVALDRVGGEAGEVAALGPGRCGRPRLLADRQRGLGGVALERLQCRQALLRCRRPRRERSPGRRRSRAQAMPDPRVEAGHRPVRAQRQHRARAAQLGRAEPAAAALAAQRLAPRDRTDRASSTAGAAPAARRPRPRPRTAAAGRPASSRCARRGAARARHGRPPGRRRVRSGRRDRRSHG